MKRISKEQIITMQNELIKRFGGECGIRDEGLLDSAVNSPFQTFNGDDLNVSVFEKAASLCFGLIQNHPFIDGNKRIGITAMLVYLKINNIDIFCSDNEIYSLGIDIAMGTISQSMICQWIIKHCSK